MATIDEEIAENGGQSSSFGMFAQPLFTWAEFPCSLHFEDASPTPEAKAALKVLHRDLLGMDFGQKQGIYGASGGGVHLLYLGREDSFPNIEQLLEMLRLSDGYKPPALKWMTTTDPVHQHMFPKTKESAEEEEDESPTVLSMDAFVNLLSNQVATRRIIPQVPAHVTANYPCLEGGRILCLLPRFAGLHDGDCLAPPTFCPTAVAFENRSDRSQVWYQFQERPEVNVDVFVEESQGVAKQAGDVIESPDLWLFQLATTGEIMALVQWDYRD